MKKLLSKIKENNQIIDLIDYSSISNSIKFKTIFYTLLISLVLIFPILLIYIELFKQFSPISFIYYVIVALAVISICLFVAFCNLIYYNLFKNYVEKEEVQKIDLKYVFLGELLNPLYLIVCIVAFAVLTYFIK